MKYYSILAGIVIFLQATGGKGSPGACNATSQMSLSRIIAGTYSDTGLQIAIRGSNILCNSYAYDKLTVLCLYDRCNETSCVQNPVSVVLDIVCRDGVWELTHYERVAANAYSIISTEDRNCTDCVDVELFESRQYPINPPDRLAYSQTTHCLMLPSCHYETGSLIGYFSARECCVKREESHYYRYEDDTFTCIVHGFLETQYSVLEGETVDIVFQRNVKGTTNFPLLSIQGSITSEGDEDDYQPVSVTLVRQDSKITFGLTAYNDTLKDSDSVILTFTSNINNYVNQVEERGEFIRHTAEVTIVDKTSSTTVSLMSELITGSEADEGVQVCATITNYNKHHNNISVNIVPTPWDNPKTADYNDFSNETIEMRFSSNEACVNIKITDDNIVEDDTTLFRESFRVTLESPDNSIMIGEISSVRVFIFDNDVVRIEIDRNLTNFTLREGSSDPAKLCASVVDPDPNCPIGFDTRVAFLTDGSSAEPYEDYGVISRVVEIKECQHTVCVDMIHYDDNIVESDEVFQVYVTMAPGLIRSVTVDRTRYDITILDNDVITIGPEPVNVHSYESVGEVEVCIAADDGSDESCPVGFPLNLTLEISQGYTESLVFEECDKIEHCLVLPIENDDQVEDEEHLNIILRSTYERGNVLLRNGTLTIFDSDVAVLGLERMIYSMDEEDGEVEICAVVYSPMIDCPITFPFELAFEVNPDTAGQGSDYRLLNGNYVFEKCQRMMCFSPVEIVNDDLIEDTETFSISLQLPNQHISGNISISPHVSSVTIRDEDTYIVSFDKAVYDIQETAHNLTVCVGVASHNASCPVDTSFSVNMFVLQYTATKLDDFVAEFITTLKFPQCSRRQCAPPITIVDDQQVENEELFDLILQSDYPQLVQPSLSHAIVNIHDDEEMAEVQLQATAYTVTEGVNDSVIICAEVSSPANGACPITFEFIVNLSVGDDNYPMVFQPCQHRECVSVPVTNDYLVEMTETLLVRLERTESLDSRIMISNSSGTLTIYDDSSDEVTVGLESVWYRAIEGEAVEVCASVKQPANIDCPIKFEFSLILSTADDSAVLSEDYEEFRGNLTFETCQTRGCVSINTLPDGCIVERNEEFIILLSSEGPLDRIHLEQTEGRVVIIDGDEAYIRFMNDTEVVLNEDDGSVRLLLAVTDEDGQMTCSSDFEIIVAMYTLPGTADIHKDFRHISRIVRFSRELIQPVIVTIIDDDTVEELNESFTVNLDSVPGHPSSIIVVNTPARITIRDNDNVTYGLERASVSVLEDVTFTVCVVLKSMKENCPVDFEFDLKLAVTVVSATSEDHDAMTTNITFGRCSRRECMNITVTDDMSLENQETFSLSLLHYPCHDDRILLDVVEKVVTITDTNQITISFDDPEVVIEGYPLDVCLSIEGAPASICPSSVPLRVVLQTFDGTAHAGFDYMRKVSVLVIPECATRHCISISTIDDATVERIEYIYVMLRNGANIHLDSKIHIPNPERRYEIIDTDMATVSFRDLSLVVAEIDGVAQICVTVRSESGEGCPVEYSFSVTIVKMDSGDAKDYDNSPVTATFPRCGTEQCADVPLYYSCDMEPNETFRAILQSEGTSDRISIDNRELVVNITDSDVMTLQLEHTMYRVDESDGHVEVCATLNPQNATSTMSFRVHIHTVSDTAGLQGPSADYSPVNTYLRFSPTVTRQCIAISITDDNLTEYPEESFTVALERADNTPERVLLTCHEASIIIIDNDDATVGFERSTYTVDENVGQVEVCVVVTGQSSLCPVTQDLSLVLLNIEQSADREDDYVDDDVTGILQIPACQQRKCLSVGIVDSAEVEEEESFYIRLFRNGLTDNIHIEHQRMATITIRDDDRAYIRLEQSVFTVMEGVNATVIICAEINPPPEQSNCPVTFSFEINLSVGENFPMTFAPCAHRTCVHVPIENDAQLEQRKEVLYRLERPAGVDNRIVVSSSSGRLTILDDLGDRAVLNLAHTVYSVREEEMWIEICANVTSPAIDTPIDFRFYVEINTVDGTAVSTGQRDFSSVRRGRIYFSIGERRDCYSVTINNDDTQENTEKFTVTLNRTSGLDPRIRLEDTVAVVYILDSDNVTIEFQRTAYTVNENVGQVELCVQFTSSHSYCPVAYDFHLVLVNMEGSASRHNDYVDADATGTLVVEACHRVKCFYVGIVDSNQLEDEESFEVSLFRNGLTDNIRIGSRKIARITIRDDDTVELGLSQPTYRVVEGQILRRYEVCMEVFGEDGDCIIPFPFIVYISTIDRTADSPSDYVSLSRAEVRLPPCTNERCVDIVTINDELVEGDENLYVSVTRDPYWDSRLRLTRSRSLVTIEDDDSARVTIWEPSYTVQEDEGRVTICAQVASPYPISETCELDFGFSVRLVPIPGTADASDYGSQITLAFVPCAHEVCGTLAITNDNVMEEQVEQFTVSLQSASTDTRVRISAYPSTVQINDDDDVIIQMQYSVYVVSESSNTVVVCAILIGTSDLYNTVRLSTISSTAVTGSPSDFTGVSHRVTFAPRDNTLQCISVTITNDEIVEDREYFLTYLGRTGGLDPRVQFGQTITAVLIEDNDRASVRLDPLLFSNNTEGESVEICAVVESSSSSLGCRVEVEFNITLQIQGTADPDDYSGLTSTLTVPECSNRHCVAIELSEDHVVEEDETILIRITRTSVSSITYDSSTTTITIHDNDNAIVRLKYGYFIVLEFIGEVRVCAVVGGYPAKVVAFPFDVRFTFIPDSATRPEDFTSTVVDARYNPDENEACAQLEVVDSYSVELTESLNVEIQLTEEHPAIEISPFNNHGIIDILDDDNAIVGLNETDYTISSMAEDVQVCVHISSPPSSQTHCPIVLHFDILFKFTNESAAVFEVDTTQTLSEGEGILREGEKAYKLLFDSCQRTFCFDVSRRNATSGDRGRFEISLSKTPDHSRKTFLDPAKSTGYIEIY